MAVATISLPLPDGPVIITDASEWATCRIRSLTRPIAALSPITIDSSGSPATASGFQDTVMRKFNDPPNVRHDVFTTAFSVQHRKKTADCNRFVHLMPPDATCRRAKGRTNGAIPHVMRHIRQCCPAVASAPAPFTAPSPTTPASMLPNDIYHLIFTAWVRFTVRGAGQKGVPK